MSTQALKAVATGQIAEQKPKTISDFMNDMKVQIAMALPKHMTAERMVRIATTEMRKVPKLAQCEHASFLGAIMQCAQLGLEPGGALGHAYLIPFENRKKGIYEVQFIVGYRGMIDLARRSGQIISISAHTVHKQDTFSYEFGLHEDLKHIPADGERGDITHVYAVARLKGGGIQFEVMSVFDIDKIKATSAAVKFNKTDSPWFTNYEEMAKKTVIRKLFKYLPVSIELTRAVVADEQADAGISQENGGVITGKYQVIEHEKPEPEPVPEEDVDPATGEVTSKTPQSEPVKPEVPETDNPEVNFKVLLSRIQNATDIDMLDADADLIKEVPGVSQKEDLTKAYRAKRAELGG